MRRRPVQILAFALLAVLVVTAAGCGSKKSASSTTTTTSTETTSTTDTSATTTDTTATTTTTTTTAGTSTSAAAALGALASSGNCQSLSQLGAAFSSAFTGANGDVQKEAALLKQFADKTPSDIKPDFETLADALGKIASAMQGYTPGSVPNASVLAKLQALQGQLDQTKLAAAETHISAWAAANCHA